MSTMSFSFSTFGFHHAPVSKFLILASSVSTFTVKFLPRRYRSLLLFNWVDITRRKQIWRIFTSLFVYDKTLDALCLCLLVYHFVLLERRWSSKKYLSFLLKNWLMSGCFYVVAAKHFWKDPTNLMAFYGPIFSLMVFYYADIPRTQAANGLLSFISDKVIVYLMAVQIMMSSKEHLLIGACGLLSGIIYRINILKIRQWDVIPNWLASRCSLLLTLFGYHKTILVSQRTLVGATPEIHQDILFDQMLRNQQQRQTVWRRQQNGGRIESAQGHPQVLNPSFAQLFENLDQPQYSNIANNVETIQSPPQLNRQLSEGKIECLTNMGFERSLVEDALRSTNGDLQEATSILLAT